MAHSFIELDKAVVLAVDVTGDRSKVRCCKEQYCIGNWNVRSMNQGKLEVVNFKILTEETGTKSSRTQNRMVCGRAPRGA